MRRWKLFKDAKLGWKIPNIDLSRRRDMMDILVVKRDVTDNYNFKHGQGFIPYTFTSKMVYSVEEWMEEFENGE